MTDFINYYECPQCGEKWEDVWDSMCDDRCPHCNISVSPYESIEVDDKIVDEKIKELYN